MSLSTKFGGSAITHLLMSILVAVILSGCSLAAYTPVVVSSSLGMNKKDLSEEPEYSKYIRVELKLSSFENQIWHLKKFEKGRYYIELSSSSERSVCELSQGYIYISKVFFDSVNDGVFYKATAYCGGEGFPTPLNRWTDKIGYSSRT